MAKETNTKRDAMLLKGVEKPEVHIKGSKFISPYRDMKDGDKTIELFYLNHRNQALIRSPLGRDLELIRKFRNRYNAKQYKGLESLVNVSEDIPKMEKILGEIDIKKDIFSLMWFNYKTAELLFVADISCEDYEEHGVIMFDFAPGVDQKSREVLKKNFANILKEHNIMKKAVEIVELPLVFQGKTQIAFQAIN